MVTYQDLRDWIATNKGEEVAKLLDNSYDECLKSEPDVTLSRVLITGFKFSESDEGHVFWWEILQRLREFEEFYAEQDQ